MKLVTFRIGDHAPAAGLAVEGGIAVIGRHLPDVPRDTIALIEA